MTDDSTRPDFKEVSNHFLHDAIDFEIRYDFCIHSDGPLFDTPRSRRAKCFVDLRMGVESILKSLICYFEHDERKGKRLVNWIEKYGHNIDKMMRKVEPHLPDTIDEKHKIALIKLNDLPVGLRYRLDTWNFRGNREYLYYETIGSDSWLDTVHNALKVLVDFANSYLVRHGRILSGQDLLNEIRQKRYEKYAVQN